MSKHLDSFLFFHLDCWTRMTKQLFVGKVIKFLIVKLFNFWWLKMQSMKKVYHIFELTMFKSLGKILLSLKDCFMAELTIRAMLLDQSLLWTTFCYHKLNLEQKKFFRLFFPAKTYSNFVYTYIDSQSLLRDLVFGAVQIKRDTFMIPSPRVTFLS